MLTDEPRVPLACQCNRVARGEWLSFAAALSTQRNHRGIFCSGTAGWARTTDLLFHRQTFSDIGTEDRFFPVGPKCPPGSYRSRSSPRRPFPGYAARSGALALAPSLPLPDLPLQAQPMLMVQRGPQHQGNVAAGRRRAVTD
jgi:hypothetical protein